MHRKIWMSTAPSPWKLREKFVASDTTRTVILILAAIIGLIGSPAAFGQPATCASAFSGGMNLKQAQLRGKFAQPSDLDLLSQTATTSSARIFQVIVTSAPIGVQHQHGAVAFIEAHMRKGLLVELANPANDLRLTGRAGLILKVVGKPFIERIGAVEAVLESVTPTRLDQSTVTREIEFADGSDGTDSLRQKDSILIGRTADGLLRLQGESHGRRLADIPHEVETATEFSRYLRRRGGDREANIDFLYASTVDGRNVPIFDGVLIDTRTKRPIANVSLKTASKPLDSVEQVSSSDPLAWRVRYFVQRFRQRVEALQQASDHEIARHFSDLPIPIKALDSSMPLILRKPWLDRIAAVNTLFRIFDWSDGPTPETSRSPAVIVIDLKKEAIAYREAATDDVRRRLAGIVREFGVRNLKVVLLWSERDVIEISAD